MVPCLRASYPMVLGAMALVLISGPSRVHARKALVRLRQVLGGRLTEALCHPPQLGIVLDHRLTSARGGGQCLPDSSWRGVAADLNIYCKYLQIFIFIVNIFRSLYLL